MKRSLTPIMVLLVVFTAGCRDKNPDLVVVCGWEEVFIADISPEVPEKVWTWEADDSPGLPVTMRNKFLTTDECKPVLNSRELLITSSGGGVALVSIKDKSASFYANVPNAHSAELLPGNRVAVAASYSPEGNRINIYNLENPGIVLASDSLFGAHGLYWDRHNKSLWAIGDYVLRKYRLDDWKSDFPAITQEVSYMLPDKGGHDLIPFGESKKLLISTISNVWIFDPASGEFCKHPDIGDEANVKSLSFNKQNETLAYVRSTGENWWAYYIRFAGENRGIYFPYEKIYKVRWLY